MSNLAGSEIYNLCSDMLIFFKNANMGDHDTDPVPLCYQENDINDIWTFLVCYQMQHVILYSRPIIPTVMVLLLAFELRWEFWHRSNLQLSTANTILQIKMILMPCNFNTGSNYSIESFTMPIILILSLTATSQMLSVKSLKLNFQMFEQFPPSLLPSFYKASSMHPKTRINLWY